MEKQLAEMKILVSVALSVLANAEEMRRNEIGKVSEIDQATIAIVGGYLDRMNNYLEKVGA